MCNIMKRVISIDDINIVIVINRMPSYPANQAAVDPSVAITERRLVFCILVSITQFVGTFNQFSRSYVVDPWRKIVMIIIHIVTLQMIIWNRKIEKSFNHHITSSFSYLETIASLWEGNTNARQKALDPRRPACTIIIWLLNGIFVFLLLRLMI